MVEWNFEAAEGGPYEHQEPEMTVTSHPTAGAVASNQFGVFQVHYATDKQVAFIRSLFESRWITDVPTAELRDELRLIYGQVQEGKVNKKAASRAIDLLLPLPEHKPEVAAAPAGPKPSQKQIDLIVSLLSERDYADAPDDLTTLTGGREGTASALITALFAAPKHGAKATARVEPGMYTHEGRIFRAYLGQQSGQILVKEVVKTGETWTDDSGLEHDEYAMEYLGLAAKHVPTGAARMSLEEAKVWGRATSSCVKCGRRLDVPESVDAGIGPVCAGKEW